MSLRASAVPRVTSSGARYAMVPISSCPLAVFAVVARARPKSPILIRPSSASSTFSGFTSRCTMPARCAAARPDSTASMIVTVCGTVRRFCSRSSSRSVIPGRYSMTR